MCPEVAHQQQQTDLPEYQQDQQHYQQDSSTRPQWRAATNTQQQQLWRQFQHDWYTNNNAMLAIDTTFYAVQGVSIALHRRIWGTAVQQLMFQTAVLLSAGAFACCLFFKPTYRRVRAPVVLAMHLVLTVLRAAVFAAAASKQATWRGPTLVVEEDHQFGPMLLAIVTVMAVPMRLFEVLGLQQTFSMHALVAVAFVALHPAAALQGARLAYSNTGFYVVHEAHDLVAAVVEGLLAAISGIPAAQQETCSSCAGLVIYNTLGLFGSVALPLYLAHVIEQAAFMRWCKRHAEAITSAQFLASNAGLRPAATASARTPGSRPHSSILQAAVSGSSSSSSSSSSAASTSCSASSSGLRRRFSVGGAASTAAAGRSNNNSNSSGRSSLGAPLPQEPLLMLLTKYTAQQEPPRLRHLFLQLLDLPSPLMRWSVHALVLVVMLVCSWVVCNAVVLSLLPRVLTQQQLSLWCPNRSYSPYVIAGQVYEGVWAS